MVEEIVSMMLSSCTSTSRIAIGTGTDVAIESADAVLMKSTMDVPAMLKLSRATIRNIKENHLRAFTYNVIGI